MRRALRRGRRRRRCAVACCAGRLRLAARPRHGRPGQRHHRRWRRRRLRRRAAPAPATSGCPAGRRRGPATRRRGRLRRVARRRRRRRRRCEPRATGDNAADGGAKAGSCDGFKNQTGITDDDDHASPTSPTSPARCPGIFESAQQATRAYVAYFNSTNDICGRKLERRAARQPRRRRRRPAGLHQGLRRGVRRGRLDVGVRLRRRRRPPQSCGLPDIRSTTTTPGAPRLRDLLRRAGGRPRPGRTARCRATSFEVQGRHASTPRSSTSTPAPPRCNAESFRDA